MLINKKLQVMNTLLFVKVHCLGGDGCDVVSSSVTERVAINTSSSNGHFYSLHVPDIRLVQYTFDDDIDQTA